jgi:spoIIIJ-associated protein
LRDRIFSGREVTEAVAAASHALAIPAPNLRYVVLDLGSPAGPGVGASPARIAVLLEAPSPAAPAAEVSAPGAARVDPIAGVRGVLRAIGEAADLDLSTDVVEEESVVRVVVAGPGHDFFLEEDAAVLRAVEHLLQRMYGRLVAPRRLLVDCEGYRASREGALRRRALELAEAVRGDGRPRATEPLNAYERRIVHLALAEAPGVRTYSVGEGADRRVTVALAGEAEE